MPLSTLLEYKALALPTYLDPVVPKNSTALETEIRNHVEQALGEPILLHKKDLPAWYYLLVFKHLYPLTPEIILELNAGFYLVLHTVYGSQEQTRPESVHIFSALLEEPVALTESVGSEVFFDLSTVPVAEPNTISSSIDFLKQNIIRTKRVTLQGQTDPLTALVSFVMWRKLAEEVQYDAGPQIITL